MSSSRTNKVSPVIVVIVVVITGLLSCIICSTTAFPQQQQYRQLNFPSSLTTTTRDLRIRRYETTTITTAHEGARNLVILKNTPDYSSYSSSSNNNYFGNNKARSSSIAVAAAVSLNELFQRTTSRMGSTTTTSLGASSSSSSSSSTSSSFADVDVDVVPSTTDGRQQQLNDHRYSASDWLHNMETLKDSSILRSIRGPVLAIFAWSTIVSIIHYILKKTVTTTTSTASSWSQYLLQTLSIPSTTPHSLVVSALGLLLVFRTNSAYSRFSEGRKIWERILSTSRNMTRLLSLYEHDAIGTERKLRIYHLLGSFPYLLHAHIIRNGKKQNTTTSNNNNYNTTGGGDNKKKKKKKNRDNNNNNVSYEDVLKIPYSLLPPKAYSKCMSSLNPPLWITDRLAKEISTVAYNGEYYTSRERLTFLSQINTLSKSVGECEGISQTLVPQYYARHSLRSLTIWLWTLPFSLVNDLGLYTGVVMGITSWLLYGIYEIGTSIEDPFQGSLRLRLLCDTIYRDVMYEQQQPTTTTTTKGTTTNTNGKKIDAVVAPQPQSQYNRMANHRETAYHLDDDEISEWKMMENNTPAPTLEVINSSSSSSSDTNGMEP